MHQNVLVDLQIAKFYSLDLRDLDAELPKILTRHKDVGFACVASKRKDREMFEKIYSAEETHLFKFQEYVKMEDEPEGQGPASEWRKIFTDDYFALLNKAAASEIMAIIQYTNQHEKANLLALRRKDTALEVITEKNKAKAVSELLKGIFNAGNGPPRKDIRTDLPN
jgi:hypothetical protein